MASIDSVADELSSLDKKVDSILDYLKQTQEDKPADFLSNYMDQKDNEERSEERRLVRLKRKKRIYQAIPVAIDSLTPEGKNELSKAIKGILPEPALPLPVEKAFKWLPLLLAGLTALGIALFAFRDKIIKFFQDIIPDFIKQFVASLIKDFIPGLISALLGGKAAAAGAAAVAPIIAGIEDLTKGGATAAAAAKEASLARTLAAKAYFGIDETGKISATKSRDLDSLIKATLRSIDPAERGRLQGIIKEWNMRTLTMSVEELQSTLFKLYKSGLKADDLYAKALTELIRLKELGFTAQEITELGKVVKPTVYSFAGEVSKTFFEELLYNLRTLPKEMLNTVKNAVTEFYRSPFTQEEYTKLVKPIEELTSGIFSSIGRSFENMKIAFLESAPVRKVLDFSSKAIKIFSTLDKYLFEPLFIALGSYEVAKTISDEIEKYGYKFTTIANAWIGSLASVFSFGIVTLEDVKKQANKEYEAFKSKNYTEVFLRELASIPDLYNKFIYGLGENITKFFGGEELSKQFEAARKSADLTKWYQDMVNSVYKKVYGWIYNIVDFIILEKGVQKPEIKSVISSNATTGIPTANVVVKSDQYYDKALQAHVEVIEKSNKEVVKTIKEDKNTTAKLAESISALSLSIAENSKNVNMINNSKNLTNITITPTTSKSYRESRFYS